MAQRAVLAVLVVLTQVLAVKTPLPAQVGPNLCACSDARDLGSCTSGFANYPGSFPGSATVATTQVGARQVTLLYVADLFEGFTYRYEGLTNGVLTANAPFTVFSSPLGSRATTGVVFNPADELLYWAIDGQLVQSNLNLGDVHVMGDVDLEGLREALGLPLPGSLGGITFHEIRQSFWGVDIVNDVYFEFRENGQLSKSDVDGKPIHFRSPLLNPFGGGAYGNGITYVSLGGNSYFDLPAGAVVEGGVTQVVRVHASAGGEDPLSFKIGDPAGVFYDIKPAVGSFEFISGIAYWPATCDATDHTEIILDIAEPGSGTPSRIYQISVDDPQMVALSRFEAAANANSVSLSWLALKPYGILEIFRKLLPSGSPVQVARFTSFNQDPRELIDRNITDGVYEYSGRVTPPSPNPRRLGDVKRRVVVGQGSVAAHQSYLDPDRPEDQDPFAITFIGSTGRLLVADVKTGHAHLYGTDLSVKGVLTGPFARDAVSGGLTTGVAWDSTLNSLLWLGQTSGGSFIQRTDLTGTPSGNRQPVDVPINIRRTPWLGDLSYDAFKKELWGVDRINMLIYSFNAAGDLTGMSSTVQVPPPRTPDGEFGGGVAVISSDPTQLVLDSVVGKAASGEPGELARVTYIRGGATGDQLTLPGSEVLTLDLRSILQAREIGGLTAVKEGEASFNFVVGVDTGTVYKLRMESGVQGKPFKRGKVLNDASPPNISDPINILNYLFKAGPALPCEDAADLNDDEEINISDPIYLFSYLFKAGPEPLPPFQVCGRDFDPPLICRDATCQ